MQLKSRDPVKIIKSAEALLRFKEGRYVFCKLWSRRLCYSKLLPYLKTGFRRTGVSLFRIPLKPAVTARSKLPLVGCQRFVWALNWPCLFQVNPPSQSFTLLHVALTFASRTSAVCNLNTSISSCLVVFMSSWHPPPPSCFLRNTRMLSRKKCPQDNPGEFQQPICALTVT